MYFRGRGPSIQLVRSQYDKTLKRAKQEVVGRVARSATKLPPELSEKLTAKEKSEFTAFVDRIKMLDSLRLKLTAHDLPRIAQEATQYAAEVKDEGERDILRQHFAEAIVLLRRASNTLGAKGPAQEE